MSQLPKGWGESRLGDVLELVNGRAYKKHEMLEDSDALNVVPILRIQNLNGGNNWFYSDLDLPENKYCYKGDLLFAWSATFGPYWARWDKTIFHYHIWNVKPSKAITKRFAYYTLCNITAAIKSAAHGVAMPHMTKSGMESWPIALPSVAEQTRIVEKLDEVLEQVDTIKARLDGIPAILKRFRQSVLAAAVSGKLTEEWRGNQGLSEPRKVYLEDLLKDKKQLSYGVLKPGDSDANGVGMIRVMDLSDWGRFANTEIFKISRDLSEQFKRTIVSVGDIVLAVMATVGRAAIIPPELSGCNVNRALAVIKLNSTITSEYMLYQIMSPQFQNEFVERKLGSAQKRINLSDLRKFEVLRPDICEQKEIVRLVDQYFAFADTIEAQVKKAQARVDKLTQSILAKAFRGELVAQDPSDEPADKLLERIAAARAEAEALAKAAKKAGRKATAN